MNLLHKVPHYDTAATIAAVDAQDITPRDFAREYIENIRPCLIRNAVKHWPAFERWRSLDYVSKKIGNPNVRVNVRPLVEIDGHPANQTAFREMPFNQVVDELQSESRGHFVLYGYSLVGKARLARLGEDIHEFSFLKKTESPRFYPQKRAFLFRDSYTDWHYHGTDENLLSQIKGSKEVLLLSPDRVYFDLLQMIAKQSEGVWNVDDSVFPEWKNIVPCRALVQEGDALYIPTYWWHAVASVEPAFGWTVAWCWRTPAHLFDPRIAGVRAMLKSLLFSRNMPLATCAAAWSLVRRFARPAFTVDNAYLMSGPRAAPHR